MILPPYVLPRLCNCNIRAEGKILFIKEMKRYKICNQNKAGANEQTLYSLMSINPSQSIYRPICPIHTSDFRGRFYIMLVHLF